jgi:hypothetical protein
LIFAAAISPPPPLLAIDELLAALFAIFSAITPDFDYFQLSLHSR